MIVVPGLTRDAQHWYRWNGGRPVPGVTGVVGVLDKSGPLVGWAKRETALCAVRNLPMLTEMVRTGGDTAAVEWLKRIPDFQRDTAADLGTRIHALADAVARGTDVTIAPEEAPYITGYLRWLETAKPKFVNSEFMVYSETHRYGGTCDAAAWLDGELWIIDYKTGNTVQESVALQLVGYARADWLGRAGDPKPYRIPKATRFGVLHVRPEGAELVPFDVTDADWAGFVAARQLFDWTRERAGVVKQVKQEETKWAA